MVTTKTRECHGMGTLGNVPLASAHGRCTTAAVSCIQWKAYHKLHVPHVIIEYLQFTERGKYLKMRGGGTYLSVC